MSTRYNYWLDALEGKPDLAISQNDPMPGFYRMKDGRPVAIWDDNDDVIMAVNEAVIDSDDHEDAWTRCATRPVTEDQYNERLASGFWHDEDPAVKATLGDNIANADDPEAIQALLAILEDASDEYRTIEDDEHEAKAQSLRARALELRSRADKLREAAKKPHLEAGKAVDKLWMPLVKSADDIGSRLRKAMEARQTRILAERRRAEAEAMKQKERVIDTAGTQEVPSPKPQIRSAYGRAASVGTRKVVTGISDLKTLAEFMSTHEEVKQVMLKISQRLIDNGFDVPGVTVEEQAVVR